MSLNDKQLLDRLQALRAELQLVRDLMVLVYRALEPDPDPDEEMVA